MGASKQSHVGMIFTFASANTQKFVGEMTKITGAFTYFGGTLGGLMQTVTKFGYAFKALGIAGLAVGAGFIAVKKAVELMNWAFEKVVSVISTFIGLVQKAANEYEKFERVAIDAAAILQTSVEAIFQVSRSATSLGISMNESAKGMQEFARAGFDAVETSKLFTTASVFARNASTNLNRATTLVTGAMRAFGIETADVSRITGAFTEAIFRSRMSFDTLETSFAYAGAAGAAAGQTFESVVASIMALRDQGLQASTSGTVFRRALSSFSKFGKEARQALDGLGISIDKVQVSSTQSFAQVIQNLADLPRTADEIKKAMDIVIAPRFGGYISLLIDRVKKGQLDLFKKTEDLIKNSGNQFDVFMYKMLSMTGQLDVFRAKTEEIWINAGRAMSPYFTKVLVIVNAFLDQLNTYLFGMPKSFEDVSKEIGEIDFKKYTEDFFDSINSSIDSAIDTIHTVITALREDQGLRVVTTLIIVPMTRLAATFIGSFSLMGAVITNFLNQIRSLGIGASSGIGMIIALFKDIGTIIGQQIKNAIVCIVAAMMEVFEVSDATIDKFKKDHYDNSDVSFKYMAKAYEDYKRSMELHTTVGGTTERAFTAITKAAAGFLGETDNAFANWNEKWNKLDEAAKMGADAVKKTVSTFRTQLANMSKGTGQAPGLPGLSGLSLFGVDLSKMRIQSEANLLFEDLIDRIDKSKSELKDLMTDASKDFGDFTFFGDSLASKYEDTGLLPSSDIVIEKTKRLKDQFVTVGKITDDFRFEVASYNEWAQSTSLEMPGFKDSEQLTLPGISNLETILKAGQDSSNQITGSLFGGLPEQQEEKYNELMADRLKLIQNIDKEYDEANSARLTEYEAEISKIAELDGLKMDLIRDSDKEYDSANPIIDSKTVAKQMLSMKKQFNQMPMMDLNTAFASMMESGDLAFEDLPFMQGMPQSPVEFFKFLDPEQLQELYLQAQAVMEERQLAMQDSVYLTIQDMTSKFQTETQLWAQFAMGAFSQIENGISTTLKNTILYGKSMTGVWKDIAKGILGSMIDTFVKIQMQALITSLFSKKIKQNEAMSRNAANVSNAYSGQAAFLSTMMLGPLAHAGALAFSGTVAGAAAAMLGAGAGGIESGGMDTNGNGLVGHAMGTDIFGVRGTGLGDTVPAMLTPGEIVLNKSASDMFREMALSGGPAGGSPITINLTIQAIDTDGFMRHSDQIVGVIKNALNDDASFRETAKVSLEG